MALAVTHVLITILLLDIFRHYVFGKKKFPRYLLVIGGIAGLAPDVDVPLEWIINWITGNSYQLHGAVTHSIIWPLIFLTVAFLLKGKWSKIFYVIAAAWFIHIPLDCLYGGYSTFLWPIVFDTKAWCPQWNSLFYRDGIDAILLIAWLVHEEIHHKIKDYF